MSRHIRFATFLLAAAFALPVFAAKPLAPEDVRVNDLVQELQKSSSHTDSLDVVWWIPGEFWSAILSQGAPTDASTRAELTRLFNQYTVVAVVKGKVGTLGVEGFESEEALRSRLHVLDAAGKPVAPIAADEVDAKLGVLIQVMRPIFKNLIGAMGDNMHFFVFPPPGEGRRLADPMAKGQFSVTLGEDRYDFRLPLGSLLVPQLDPATGESFPGSFSFNPYTGAPLRAESP